MKKTIIALILTGLFAFAQAESLTGFVFSENNGKYWRIGKKGGSGENVALARLPMEEASKLSALEGKTVKVTGDLDPSASFKTFKSGCTFEEVTE